MPRLKEHPHFVSSIEVTSRVLPNEVHAIPPESHLPVGIILGLLGLVIGTLSLHLHPDPKILGASLRVSRPLLNTAYVKPWSRVRDASDLFDEYEWENAPPLLSQPHSAVTVKRDEDFRTISPSAVVTLTPEEAEKKILPKSWVAQYTPTYPDPEPTEGDLAKWRKKYLTKDGKRFKPPSKRARSLCRFQATPHMNYKFKRIGEVNAPDTFEDGLSCEDIEEERVQREDPDQNQNRAVDITEDFPSTPKLVQVRPAKLDRRISDYNKQASVEAFTATQSETDWWEARLARAFRLDFEKERNRADAQFEQWRREAWKLRKNEDFKHWHDVLDKSRLPSWGMTRSAYSPEPRGKFRVVNKTSRQFAHPGNWFDHVFEAPTIKEKPNKKAMEKFVGTLSKKDQVKYAPIIKTIYGDEGTKHATEKGIKMKSQDKAVQRLMKKFEKYQQSGGHLYDPSKLRMPDIDLILSRGGSYVVLPPEREGLALELIPVVVENGNNPKLRGLLDGLAGISSDSAILVEMEMQAKRDARDVIDAKKFPRGRRNRDVQAAFENITKRFALADVIHFGDPERLRERVAEQVSLNKDEESL